MNCLDWAQLCKNRFKNEMDRGNTSALRQMTIYVWLRESLIKLLRRELTGGLNSNFTDISFVFESGNFLIYESGEILVIVTTDKLTVDFIKGILM